MLNRIVAASERYLESLVRQQGPEAIVSSEEVVRQRLHESQAEADRRWNTLMAEVQAQYERAYSTAWQDGALDGALDALDWEGSDPRMERFGPVDWRKEGF